MEAFRGRNRGRVWDCREVIQEGGRDGQHVVV